MKRSHSDSTATAMLASNLREAIEKGTLKPGDKLPTQQQMELQYGVSRIVVREAIKMLEGMGFLYSRQGSGIYVSSHPSLKSHPGQRLSGEYRLSEIYTLFEALFDYAVFEIVRKPDLSDVEALRRLNDQARQNFSELSVHQKFSYETTFCSSILRFANNELASDLYLLFVKPLTNADYTLIFDEKNFLQILDIDMHIIQMLLERDPYKARFWRQERDAVAIKVFSEKNIWDKTFSL